MAYKWRASFSFLFRIFGDSLRTKCLFMHDLSLAHSVQRGRDQSPRQTPLRHPISFETRAQHSEDGILAIEGEA